jgi:hypothetical protein
LYAPKPWDSDEHLSIKAKIRKLYSKQDDLELKYKCVKEYAEYGFEIKRLKEKLEQSD